MTEETPAELERRILSRLHPLEGEPGGAGAGSDYDLNPDPDSERRPLAEAAVLVPLVLRPAGITALFTRRTDTLSRHPGQVAFPGGRCDPGETPVQTALRETFEEVGLAPEFVRPLALAGRYVTGTGYRITPVAAFVREGFTLAASPAEVAEVFETPWAWLMEPANVVLDGREFAGVVRRFHSYSWAGRTIWGATAGILQRLRERLYDPLPPGQESCA